VKDALDEAIAIILNHLEETREGLLTRLERLGTAPNLQAALRQSIEEARSRG